MALPARFGPQARASEHVATALLAALLLVAGAVGCRDSKKTPTAAGRPATSSFAATPSASGSAPNPAARTTSSTSQLSETTARSTDVVSPPKTLVYRGTGETRLKITKPGPGNRAVVYITGGRNFLVSGRDAKDQLTDLGVFAVGGNTYRGLSPLDFDGTHTTALQIHADGPWTVEVRPVASIRRFDGKTSGTGDEVLYFTGQSRKATISHNGEGNFAVVTYPVVGGSKARTLRVNVIGPYHGDLRWSADAVIVVRASGRWTIDTE